ncbi:MAG: formamidopyrimidine-DNA glycosylase, partial [Deltaproteobacteria bacterium]
MPELPEVETVRRTLLPHVVGRTVAQVQVLQPKLREVVDVAALQALLPGRRITAVRRRAKYLLFDLSGDGVLMVHLG